MSELEQQALLLSLRVAATATLFALPIATALAWLLARPRWPGKPLLEAAINLPLVLPPVVIGYALLLAFGRRGPLGAWLHDWLGISFVFTFRGAVLAAAVMALPLMVRAVRQALEAVDGGLEDAARSLGASRLDAVASVTLPLAAPGLLSGAVLGFAASLGEFGATITFVSNVPGQTQTLPLAIYSALQSADGEQAALRLVLCSVVLALLALALAQWSHRRLARWLGAQGGR
ncbi:MAG TPA: molybdate ABC transporter permease subunit [Methylibium sp.]|uniref:molybdate ABC transporter permease subunit n=1 Tax=Methylibium sp. TaxID=2067992 RepID=UPI002DBFE50A|nr:molybdate ABC transporter permease subunit [Methylibium sp.]HEU4458519.1 molybdate ABC transporter permease subunit [Methylibium sp.]